MFRAHYDPMIGPMPRNAFKVGEIGMTANLLMPIGVWVKVTKTGREHIVPFANIQSIELEVSPIAEVKPLKAKKSEAI